MASLQEAIRKTAPGPTGATTNVCQPYNTAVTVSASTAGLVLPNAGGIPDNGCYVTWVFTVDTHLRVAETAALVGSAATTDFFFAAGSSVDLWHEKTIDANFSVIRGANATADGLVIRYRSNR